MNKHFRGKGQVYDDRGPCGCHVDPGCCRFIDKGERRAWVAASLRCKDKLEDYFNVMWREICEDPVVREFAIALNEKWRLSGTVAISTELPALGIGDEPEDDERVWELEQESRQKGQAACYLFKS